MSALFLCAWGLFSAVVANGVFLVLALLAALPRRRKRWTAPIGAGALVMIRPFRGLDSEAFHKHRSLIDQTYRPCSIRFACTASDDPGWHAARRACATAPGRAHCLLAVDSGDAVSDKARNMIASWRATTEPFVAFCDSDLTLHPEAVTECMSGFDEVDVGAVFARCLVRSTSRLGRLSMLTLTADAYALLSGCARLGVVPFMQGGLMILRRHAVDRSGGIEVISDAVGDDTRLGRALRRARYSLRLAPFVLVHQTPDESVSQWAARYRRWMGCHRADAGPGFWAELLLNPTVAPLIASGSFTHHRSGVLLLFGSVFVRTSVTAFIDRRLLRPHGVRLGWWALARPLADIVHMVMCVSVLVYPWIDWRGIRYFIGARGRLVRVSEHTKRHVQSSAWSQTPADSEASVLPHATSGTATLSPP